MKTRSELHKLEHSIRDLINDPRKRYDIQGNKSDWHRLCSSLDVLGDTQLAIESFDRSALDKDRLDGYGYLIIYGLLQALFLQQDASRDIANSLHMEFTLPASLKKIRDIRNDASGHPTDRYRGRYFCAINRSSIHASGFSYYKYGQDEEWFSDHHIDIADLIDAQESAMYKLLLDILNKLKCGEKMHREKHRNVKMKDIFPSALQYYFQKMDEAIYEFRSFRLGAMHIDLTEEILNKFENELAARGELENSDWYQYHREKIEYPLSQLKLFFYSDDDCEINARTASIFVWYIQTEMNELLAIAQEIDELYEEDI